jgi:hypothetical protein
MLEKLKKLNLEITPEWHENSFLFYYITKYDTINWKILKLENMNSAFIQGYDFLE